MIDENTFEEFEKDSLYAIMSETEKLAKVGGWEWDIGKDSWTFSDNWLRIHGCSSRHLKSADLIPIAHPDDRADVQMAFDKAVSEGVDYEIEHRIIRQDTGEERYIRAHGRPKLDDYGKTLKLCGSAQDITEFKKAEQSVQQSERRLKASIESGGIGLWELNLSDLTAWRSLTHDQIFGYETILPEWTYEMFLEHVVEEDRHMVEIKLGRALKNKELWDFQCKIKRKDGAVRWIHAKGKPEIDANLIPVKMYGTLQDITDQIEDRAELTKIKAILDGTGRMAQVGGWEVDTNTMELIWTNETYRIHEMPLDVKPTLQEGVNFYHPEDRNRLSEAVLRALEEGESFDLENRLITAKGNHRWTRAICIPLIENRKVVKLQGTFQDITERKQTEKALRKSHETFLTVLNSIDATIYVADMQNYEVLFMNKCMINSFGRDMTGEICWEAFRGEAGKCSYCHNDQLIDENGKPTGVYTWQDQNPITGKWYNNYDRAIEWTDGRLVKIQIATDITEMKHMEEQLRQAHKMEAVGTLAGGIAHDFNNILGAIIGYTEMIQEDCPVGSTMRNDIDRVVEASHRAKELVKQILAFTRQTKTDEQLLQPAYIIKEALKMIRSSIPKTIEIEQNIDSRAGLVLADPTQIHQIITNLCTNAFHAMEETGGTLNISLKNKDLASYDLLNEPHVQPGLFVEISVDDTGPGISPKIIDKIFDPFFTTKEVGKGTGMGLAIIHGIAKKSGGFVCCKSSRDEGTIFNVYLPVHEPTAQPEGEITSLELIQTGIERILFIDDEEMLAQLGKTMLERLGYRVTVKTSSIEALTTIQNQPEDFDLVITDQTMPAMTGSDLARRILQIRPELPIILCTGFSNQISEEKARIYGIKGFAMKPLAQKDLAALIRKVLDEET